MSMKPVILCVSFAAYVAHSFVVDHENGVFRDQLGRQRLWHGINIVQKSAPFHPSLDHFVPGLSVTSEDIDVLHALGASVVRLGVMMPGMYPTAELNRTYLATVKDIIDRLHQNGIGTIIDLHQDVLAPKVCGEGTPDWMLNVSSLNAMSLPRPAAFDKVAIDPKTGRPTSCAPTGFLKFIGWSEWYMTDQCGKAFDELYKGESAMSKAFESYWATVAKEFKGHPGVVAYELLNEPWVGDHVGNPLLLLESGKAEKEEVSKYMQRMHDLVRAADPDTLILYAPAEVNNRAMRRVGYEYGFLPEAAMAYHVYCIVGTDGSGPTNPILKELCHFNDGFSLKQRQEDLARLKTAGFVTEFGAVNPSKTGFAEVEFVLDHFDKMDPPTSWAFWDFGEIQRQNTTNKAAYIKLLARPYPRAIAGHLVSMVFDAQKSTFDMKYTMSKSNATTELFIPTKTLYTSGFSVHVDPPGLLSIVETSYGIDLVPSHMPSNEQTITVSVVSKPSASEGLIV